MNIEIKKSKKPVKYHDAIRFMEERLKELNESNNKELIWTLEHEEVFTAGNNYKENEVLDKSIKIVKTNRGGKLLIMVLVSLYSILSLILKKEIKILENLFQLLKKH